MFFVYVFFFSHYFLGIPFHWIFSESAHGKEEHDGHGAVVKQGIHFYVLVRMYFFFSNN